MKINAIKAREIFDSRGLPTVECHITIDTNKTISASVPSGASRGGNEARELRDGGTRFFGLGVMHAVELINTTIANRLVGKTMDALEVDTLLLELDPTPEKSRLGANTTLAVSIAAHKAQAANESIPTHTLISQLYDVISSNSIATLPWFNCINGGMHAKNKLRAQEMLIIVRQAPTILQQYEIALEIFYKAQSILCKKNIPFGIGDEGGISAPFFCEEEALDIIIESCEQLQLSQRGIQVSIALDMAASHFFDASSRMYNWHNGKISSDQLIEWYEKIIKSYPIMALEDPFCETDFDGWRTLFSSVGNRILIVGDDLVVTDPMRIEQYTQDKLINSAIIKPNQIGTIMQTIQAIKSCKKQNIPYITSHRSGETNDDFLADFTIGTGALFVKAGGCSRGERIAKFNRFIEIEEETQ